MCVRGACVRVFVALGNGLDRKTAEEVLVSEAGVSIYIIRNARIENVVKYQSCMVFKLRIIVCNKP